MDWTDKLKKDPERPLPGKGCSIAFYLFLLGMLIFFLVMYIFYRNQL